MIHYRIAVADAAAHLFQVTLAWKDPLDTPNRVAMPAWIPGSYMIREFARNIQGLSLKIDGRRQPIQQISKDTWEIARRSNPGAQQFLHSIELSYRVYAWDFSVRAAHLDSTHGFFNFSSLALRVVHRDQEACEVTLVAHHDAQGSWTVATTLPPVNSRSIDRYGYGRYQVPNYDALIDYPVEMGRFVRVDFTAQGVPHRAVFTGRFELDPERLARDLKAICSTHIELFEPRSKKAPFQQYLFMTHVSTDGYGGLEHRDSTALHCPRADLPYPGMTDSTAGYRKFLGLCSHEYFHSWNVKRIKPKAFTPYDLQNENYTSLLWLFEGFTSYYDDLILLRAGVISLEQYLEMLAKTIISLLNTPGRQVQTVAQSSFESWTKYYRQDENSPNAIISYYLKGSLVALCMDLTIRQKTRQRRSLDDVMRLLWKRFGSDKSVGLGENEFPDMVLQATGCDLRSEIRRWTETTAELPLRELLVDAGFSWEEKYETFPDLGMRLTQKGGDCVVSHVIHGGPAHQAGVSAGDLLIAANGLRVNEARLREIQSRHKPGARLKIGGFRRDEWMEFNLKLGHPALVGLTLKPVG